MKFQGEKIHFKHFLGWQGWQLEWNGLPCTDLVLGIVLFGCLFQGQWEDENSYIKRMGRYQTNVKDKWRANNEFNTCRLYSWHVIDWSPNDSKE